MKTYIKSINLFITTLNFFFFIFVCFVHTSASFCHAISRIPYKQKEKQAY